MQNTELDLLKMIADIDGIPSGAHNIRANGETGSRVVTENVDIVTKTDKPGIDIIIKAGTKGESVHIPVVISKTDYTETVYNDFYIGDDADVTIMAGCGIHNCGDGEARHDGIHTFYVGKNAKVKYIEKHYGEGDGTGGKNMNPTTIINIADGGYMEMETTQIKGIDSTNRITNAVLGAEAKLVIHEKLMTLEHSLQARISPLI